MMSQYLESQRVLKIICHNRYGPVRGSERHKHTHTRERRHGATLPKLDWNYISHNSYSCIHKHQRETTIYSQTQMHKNGHIHVGTWKDKTFFLRRAYMPLKYRNWYRSVDLLCMYTVGRRKLSKEWREHHTQAHTARPEGIQTRERWAIIWCHQAVGYIYVQMMWVCVHLIQVYV